MHKRPFGWQPIKWAEIAGWIGLALIHGATLPTTVKALLGYSVQLPPLSMVAMIWTGLALFLIQACAARNMLYIVSNAIGFALQTALLSLIVFRG